MSFSCPFSIIGHLKLGICKLPLSNNYLFFNKNKLIQNQHLSYCICVFKLYDLFVSFISKSLVGWIENSHGDSTDYLFLEIPCHVSHDLKKNHDKGTGQRSGGHKEIPPRAT